MTRLLRPKARALLHRWREVVAGAAIVAATLVAASFSFGVTRWTLFALAAAGAALTVTALQRLRFSRGGGGAGVVRVVERRITYLGPLDGGFADLGALTRLTLDPTGRPAHWRLLSGDGTTLDIPVDALGADALFDTFAALPGIRSHDILAALNDAPDRPVTVWQVRAPERTLLH